MNPDPSKVKMPFIVSMPLRRLWHDTNKSPDVLSLYIGNGPDQFKSPICCQLWAIVEQAAQNNRQNSMCLMMEKTTKSIPIARDAK
jgi:hypothetical protein